MSVINRKYLSVTLLNLLAFSITLLAGPPYDTDDPQPVDFQHWEFYCSSIGAKSSSDLVGTAPHFEVNYGILPNVQLHVISPLSFYSVQEDKTNFGYGDTEFGTKFRFVNKDSSRFQIGVFPLIEIPTGNAEEHLGNGNAQIYLPLWIQKTMGKWITYGGGGYWINPGAGNKNYEFLGWQAQYQFVKPVSIGAELCYTTASQVGANSDFRFRIGSIVDFTQTHHLLFSIGRSIIGNTNLQWYLGYQLTI
ncbi:MAG TPA: hypothetical protein VK783_06970 [Bacteroidia bacterium]|jgi:hypothetical protein|nr:hypothetical protein [Bacteroidia bacterium]